MYPAPPAIVAQIPAFQRCRCPECARLDARHPGEGFQLALFTYAISIWRGRGARA